MQLIETVKTKEKIINLDLSNLKGLTKIGYQAFCDCKSLACVTIPDSMTSIGENAFRDCRSLTSVTFEDSIIQIERIIPVLR